MTDRFKDLTYAVADHIATITLARPDARNAYSAAMVESLIGALDAASDDDDVRVVVLTGEGKCFSAGGDLKLMRDKAGMFEGHASKLRTRYAEGIQKIPRRMAAFDKPIVGAVNGAAIGAGLDLACMCDIRIASARARFGSTFVRVGLVPGDGGAYLLTRTVGYPRALELMLTARVIDSEEALRIGLVHSVVEPDALMETALDKARTIAAIAPLAVQLTKSAAVRSYDMNLDQSLNLAATYQGIVQNTEDHLEGVDALLERREPTFKGR